MCYIIVLVVFYSNFRITCHYFRELENRVIDSAYKCPGRHLSCPTETVFTLLENVRCWYGYLPVLWFLSMSFSTSNQKLKSKEIRSHYLKYFTLFVSCFFPFKSLYILCFYLIPSIICFPWWIWETTTVFKLCVLFTMHFLSLFHSKLVIALVKI